MDAIQHIVTHEESDPTNEPDAMLALRASRDRRAFLTLYDRYAPQVGLYVISRLGPGPDAEDMVSTAFLQALANIDSYTPRRGTFIAWLFGITRNAIRMHHRSHPPMAAADMIEHQADASLTPEESVAQQERSQRLRAAITRLTPEQQEALSLRYLGGLSFADAAHALGRSEGAAKMLVQRGLEALRRIILAEEAL